MQCPAIANLPLPAPHLRGWPWTEASAVLPPTMPDGKEWPRITIVTPSFNQKPFLEATIRSILLQGYPNLEYVVMDGGSTDGSVEIIEKYAPWLTRWVSERDGGQSAAINNALRNGSGSFATWINSDDMLCRNALTMQALRFGFRPNTVYVGDCTYIDVDARPLNVHRGRVRTFEDLVRVRTVWRARGERGHIVQPEVIFPRELALAVGALDPGNHQTMDYDLWGRLLLAGAAFEYTHISFAMFRLHAEQKTGQAWGTTKSLIATAERLVARAPHLSDAERQAIIADLRGYQKEYWRETGPLACLGLPEAVVAAVRNLESTLRGRVRPWIRRDLQSNT